MPSGLLKLVCQALVAVGQVDDAAVAEAVGENAVLHYMIVTVSVYPKVWVLLSAPVHYGFKNAVGVRCTAYSVNDVIGKSVFQP